MKRIRNLIRSVAVAWALMLGLPELHAVRAAESEATTQDRPTANPAGNTSTETSHEADTLVEPPANTRKRSTVRRVHELVSIGSDAKVDAGETADEVVVVGGDAVLEGDVDGDVVVIFGKLKVTGNVDGDVLVVLGEAEVDGRITGDAAFVLSRARLAERARIDGDVVAVGVAPEIHASAILREHPKVYSLGPVLSYFEGIRDYVMQGVLLLRPFPPRVGWVWLAAGAFLAFHLILAVLFSGPLRSCMVTVREQSARSFIVGLVVCILVGPASLLLSFTVLAPLMIGLGFFVACVFGRMAVYGVAGMAATGRLNSPGVTGNPAIAMLIGSLLFYVSYMIPIVGFLVYALILPIGVGAVVIRLFEALSRDKSPAVGAPGRGNLVMASSLVSGTPGPATHAAVGSSGPPPLVNPDVPPVAEAIPPRATTEPPPVFPLGGIESLTLPRVGFWPRFAATLVDLILVGVVNAVTFQEAESFWVYLAAYHLALWSWRGTTVGGCVMNLRLVRLDGRAMNWQTAVVRLMGAVVSLVPLGLGFFWASWDSEFQSWHDRIAGTTIVKPDRRVTLV